MPAHWRAWLTHAWGPPEATSDTGAAGPLADEIRRHGLALPAEVAAEAHRPLLFVYAQLAHAATPILDALLPGRRVAQLAAALEDPRALDALLARLRAPESSAPASQPPSAGGRTRR